MLKKYIIVQTHTNKKQVCEDISRSLIEKRMAACVNIYPAVLSMYRYNSEVIEDNEYLIHAKTTIDKFHEIRMNKKCLNMLMYQHFKSAIKIYFI